MLQPLMRGKLIEIVEYVENLKRIGVVFLGV
jgi:hypothetical protein